MRAAVSPTSCLSMPVILISVWRGVAKVMPVRRRNVDLVREAELHRERPALHRRAVADADQLERLLVALR